MSPKGSSVVRPWSEIVTSFRERQAGAQHLESLAALAAHIGLSPLGKVLHGATSHEHLLISPLPHFGQFSEVLQVEANPEDGALDFRYASAAGGPRWHKHAASGEGIATLEKFVRELKWVT